MQKLFLTSFALYSPDLLSCTSMRSRCTCAIDIVKFIHKHKSFTIGVMKIPLSPAPHLAHRPLFSATHKTQIIWNSAIRITLQSPFDWLPHEIIMLLALCLRTTRHGYRSPEQNYIAFSSSSSSSSLVFVLSFCRLFACPYQDFPHSMRNERQR